MKPARVVCIKTEGYPFSLVVNTVYETVPDHVAENHKMIRVIDETGEDYLYPAAYFVPASATANAPDREFSPRA